MVMSDDEKQLHLAHQKLERWALIGFLLSHNQSELDNVDCVVLADQLLKEFDITYKGI